MQKFGTSVLFKLEQGESARLPDSDFNGVFREFDVEGGAYDLFVLGLGNQQPPKEAPSRGKGGSGSR